MVQEDNVIEGNLGHGAGAVEAVVVAERRKNKRNEQTHKKRSPS